MQTRLHWLRVGHSFIITSAKIWLPYNGNFFSWRRLCFRKCMWILQHPFPHRGNSRTKCTQLQYSWLQRTALGFLQSPLLLRRNSRFQGTAPSVICVSLFLLDPAILERMLAHRTEIIARRDKKTSRPGQLTQKAGAVIFERSHFLELCAFRSYWDRREAILHAFPRNRYFTTLHPSLSWRFFIT
jgi:hypothetical protein